MLLYKSKENINSADFLYQKGNYNSAVHCAYYSFFQLASHVDGNKLKPIKGEYSHDNLISAFYKDLKGDDKRFKCMNTFKLTPRKIKDKMSKIKALRMNADYDSNSKFTTENKDVVEDCIKETKLLLGIFEQLYKNQL